MKKRILLICQYFYPEQFRINDICTEWVKKGYKVTVLTGIPNYPDGDFYKGYGWLKKRKENWNGIEVIRLPIIPRKHNKIMLALNYISYPLVGGLWILFSRFKADMVFIYQLSPVMQALPGIWYAKKNKIPCYTYVLDLWPESLKSILNISNPLLLKPIGKCVDYMYQNSDEIFVSSKGFVEKIKARGIEEGKIKYWPQYAEEFYIKYEGKDKETEIPQDNILNLTFAGNIGEAQGLNILIETSKILQKMNIQVRFNIIGDGRYKEKLKGDAVLYGTEKYFNFIDRKPAKDIPKYFAASDASIVTLAKSDVFSLTVPAKVQSSMACGIPIIGALDGEAQVVIREANCGFCSETENEKLFADNIVRFMKLSKEEKEKMAENALDYYKKNFEKFMLINKMDKYIKG